jgi:hypothetical protein
MFYDYYGDFNYADKWVSAALAGTSMSFSSGKHGPNDFSTLGNAARVEAVKKGTAYMNVWMYAIREFEDAIDDCSSCTSECNEFSVNSGSVHAWDEGVAFYTGTLEGHDLGGDSGGKLVYRLAEKRCKNFGTCGSAGDQTSGTAYVNHELFEAFAYGRDLLQQGSCEEVRPVTNAIVSLMTVPLVQGSLRYAYKVGEVPADRSAKNAAEGATFSAAVLPLVNYCNSASAKIISDELKFGQFDASDYPDWPAVKSAFESTYDCLGISCAHVGGLVGSDGVALAESTMPCTFTPSTYPAWTHSPSPPPSKAVIDDDSVGVVVAVVVAGVPDDYNTPARKAELECAMAEVAQVLCDAVTVKVSAASVKLEYTIVAASATQAAAISTTTTAALASTSTASTLLGAQVEQVPTVSGQVSFAPPSPPPAESSGLSTGAISGIAVGARVGVLGAIAIMVYCMKSGGSKQKVSA